MSEIYLKYVSKLGRTVMTAWVDLDCLSRINHMSYPYYFWKIILQHFKSKNDTKSFIPQINLICHKLNFFRHTCDFLVGRTTTIDFQWRVSYYLKRLLWPNINWNKIANNYTRLNVLTKYYKLLFIYVSFKSSLIINKQ